MRGSTFFLPLPRPLPLPLPLPLPRALLLNFMFFENVDSTMELKSGSHIKHASRWSVPSVRGLLFLLNVTSSNLEPHSSQTSRLTAILCAFSMSLSWTLHVLQSIFHFGALLTSRQRMPLQCSPGHVSTPWARRECLHTWCSQSQHDILVEDPKGGSL